MSSEDSKAIMISFISPFTQLIFIEGHILVTMPAAGYKAMSRADLLFSDSIITNISFNLHIIEGFMELLLYYMVNFMTSTVLR